MNPFISVTILFLCLGVPLLLLAAPLRIINVVAPRSDAAEGILFLFLFFNRIVLLFGFGTVILTLVTVNRINNKNKSGPFLEACPSAFQVPSNSIQSTYPESFCRWSMTDFPSRLLIPSAYIQEFLCCAKDTVQAEWNEVDCDKQWGL